MIVEIAFPAACAYVPARGRNEHVAYPILRAPAELRRAPRGWLEPFDPFPWRAAPWREDPPGPPVRDMPAWVDAEGGTWRELVVDRPFVPMRRRVTETDFLEFLVDGPADGPSSWIERALLVRNPLRVHRPAGFLPWGMEEAVPTGDAATARLDAARSIRVDGRAVAAARAVRHVEGEYLLHDGLVLVRDRDHILLSRERRHPLRGRVAPLVTPLDHGTVAAPADVAALLAAGATLYRGTGHDPIIDAWLARSDGAAIDAGIVRQALDGMAGPIADAVVALCRRHPAVACATGADAMRRDLGDLARDAALGACGIDDPPAALRVLGSAARAVLEGFGEFGLHVPEIRLMDMAIQADYLPRAQRLSGPAVHPGDEEAIGALGRAP